MTIKVLMRSDGEFSFADAETLIEKTLQDIMSNPLNDEDVQSVITGITSDKLYGLETVHEKLDYISVHETYLGQPDYFEDDLQRYMSVTPDDIAKAFTRHIKDASAVITRVVPNGPTDLIIPEDNHVYPGRKIPSLDRISRPEWQAPEDDFDRSVKPETGSVEQTTLPSYTKFNLANTVPVFLMQSDETPMTTIENLMDIGRKADTGLRVKELAFTKAYFTKSNALNFESHAQKVFLLSRLALYGLDQNYLDDQAEALRSMTVDTLNQKSRSIFDIERQIIVIVGSKTDMFNELSSLGYPVIEVDETGKSAGPG